MAGCVPSAAPARLLARRLSAGSAPPLPLSCPEKLDTDSAQLDLPREPCPPLPEGVPEARRPATVAEGVWHCGRPPGVMTPTPGYLCVG